MLRLSSEAFLALKAALAAGNKKPAIEVQFGDHEPSVGGEAKAGPDRFTSCLSSSRPCLLVVNAWSSQMSLRAFSKSIDKSGIQAKN
jgi:hypothetical protein